MNFKRTSIVDCLKINAAEISSVIQLGDSSYIQSFTRALAVQREEEIFFGKEGDFNNYRIFSEPIPFLPFTERISIDFYNPPFSSIKVKRINLGGASSSGVVHIGNSKHIQMESRIKHIRHLIGKPEQIEAVVNNLNGNNGK